MLTPQDAIAALKANRYSQDWIASKLGCTQGTISNISRGAQPNYGLGAKIMKLGHRYGKKGAKK